GNRVRAGLETALREAMQAGRLVPGTRLPSSRSLAVDLGIARNTVADAAALSPKPTAGPRSASKARPGRYDLRAGSPDLSAFPRAGWLSAARKALSAAPSQALGYGDPRGLPELRTVLAGYLARARGVRVSPDRVVVCGGFTQGLALLCQVLPAAGVTSIALEEYGRVSSARALAASGLAPVLLSV